MTPININPPLSNIEINGSRGDITKMAKIITRSRYVLFYCLRHACNSNFTISNSYKSFVLDNSMYMFCPIVVQLNTF